MEWFYSENDQQHGPISESELKAKFDTGSLSLTTLVWKEGMTDWVPAQTCSEFVASSSGVGAPLVNQSLPPGTVPNYLWQSICCLLLCCTPLGIVALVYAMKVDSQLVEGNLEGAEQASAQAKLWCWISFGLGLVAHIVSAILLVIYFGAIFSAMETGL